MWISSVLVGAVLVHCSYALLHGRRGLQPRGSNDTNPEAIWTTVCVECTITSACILDSWARSLSAGTRRSHFGTVLIPILVILTIQFLVYIDVVACSVYLSRFSHTTEVSLCFPLISFT
ncbi:hypothetical protein F5887DRAFT_522640 [Amanita rubescens]|nr:hypothetical protein F5887DRAFT_522640 [Amanita rubescens]